FSVTKQNADFLEFQFAQPVVVPARQSVRVPVIFRAKGQTLGDHSGIVMVQCLDCDEYPPCNQSPKTLGPHIRVVPRLNAVPAGVSNVAARVCWKLGVERTGTEEAKALNDKVVAQEQEVERRRQALKQARDTYTQLERESLA